MNLKQLEAFLAIMETGSTIGAATRLGLSQSAVSRLLGQLEEHLGFAMFLRRKGRLMVTPEAEAFLPAVSDLVDRLQRVQRLAADLRHGSSQRTLLKVGVPNSMAQHRLPPIVASFLRERPDVVIELLSGGYDTLERAVLDRDVDFAFVRLPTELQGFEVIPLLEAEGVCVLPEGHPLCAKDEIHAADLRDQPLVLLGRQRNLRHELELALRRAGFAPQVRVEVHSVGAACSLVAEGIGLSIINSLLARDFAHLPIVTRPFRPLLSYSFGLVLRSDVPPSLVSRSFAEHLREALGA
ncbi:LysR family transcriptional regulator [Pseudomonas sp. QE6]|uniref:LysR family transcriptional regulator n=1 Tax=Pseudomonas sp. QE6 TaxID=3242491 RepID=UPI0035289C62